MRGAWCPISCTRRVAGNPGCGCAPSRRSSASAAPPQTVSARRFPQIAAGIADEFGLELSAARQSCVICAGAPPRRRATCVATRPAADRPEPDKDHRTPELTPRRAGRAIRRTGGPRIPRVATLGASRARRDICQRNWRTTEDSPATLVERMASTPCPWRVGRRRGDGAEHRGGADMGDRLPCQDALAHATEIPGRHAAQGSHVLHHAPAQASRWISTISGPVAPPL
jgi:hypothetical protein